VVAAPDALVVAGAAAVVLLEFELSLPHAAAISEAPSSAMAACAVLLNLMTSWVRDGERGRDAARRPDNLPHQMHPCHGWATRQTTRFAAIDRGHRSTGQNLPFDVRPSNGAAT
jgi:hypothetical protein